LASEVDRHTRHSTLREHIVEHVFIGDVLRRCWQFDTIDVEVLRSEFDAGGYDLVISLGSIIRHIQMKSKLAGGKSSKVSLNLRLMDKPSGCVIWIVVDDNLTPMHYLWFGSPRGMPLPNISGLPVARHAKANSEGIKNPRPQQRVLRQGQFEKLDTLDDLMTRLFGEEWPAS